MLNELFNLSLTLVVLITGLLLFLACQDDVFRYAQSRWIKHVIQVWIASMILLFVVSFLYVLT